MFRQIRTHWTDRIVLRIVWSLDLEWLPVEFQMTTLTYGSSCASYLAIRSLLQLAADEKDRFLLGARCLDHHTYVDDIFEGADELSVAVQKKNELIEILRTGEFELDKWSANHPDLLPARAPQDQGASKEINREESVKTLGVHWVLNLDEFKFTYQIHGFSDASSRAYAARRSSIYGMKEVTVASLYRCWRQKPKLLL